jgi:hypothetical protein
MCRKRGSQTRSCGNQALGSKEVEEVDQLEKPDDQPVNADDNGIQGKGRRVKTVLAKDGVVAVEMVTFAMVLVWTDECVPGRCYHENDEC